MAAAIIGCPTRQKAISCLQLLTMAKPRSTKNKKIANSLVAMSSAAVLAVYSAGYARTRSAADRFEARAAERRQADARPARAGSLAEPFPPGAPAGRAMLPASGTTREDAGKPVQIASVEPPSARANLPGGAATASPAQTPAPSTSPAPQAASQPASQPAAYSATVAAPAVNQPAAPSAPVPDHKYVDITAAAPAPAGSGLWKDGTYYGWGFSPHGDIQAEVYIEGGRIVVASISDCRTRYSCSVIDKLPPQVARRQSAEVDYITGATESAEAFYDAVKEALSKAK